jgi:hypothetical protein
MITDHAPNHQRVLQLNDALDAYRLARQHMLTTLGLDISNRDPLAEWSEHIVAALVGGELAPSRVQAGYDLTTPSGLRVQVRYLANRRDTWVNWHVVRTPAGADRYALVLFEAFEAIGVLLFPPQLTAICDALAKRHGDRDVSLQFTRRNWWTIRDDHDRFRQLGMAVWLPPFAAAPTREDR